MGLRIGTLGIALACLAWAAGPDGEADAGKTAALEEAKALLDGGEWEEAARALKRYKRKYAESEEEEARLDALILRAEGEEEFAEIQEDYRKKNRVRRAMADIREFLEDYGKDEDLRRKGEEFREAVRSVFVQVITDFEDDDWPTEDGGMTFVTDEEMVKHGKQAARWDTGVGDVWVHINPPVQDWTPYRFFCFWIYNEKRTKRPGYILFRPGRSGSLWEHHYEYVFPIDFIGWREVRIDFAGKKGFGKTGSVDWSSIEEVQIHHPGETGIPVDVIIDDIRLEKAVR